MSHKIFLSESCLKKLTFFFVLMALTFWRPTSANDTYLRFVVDIQKIYQSIRELDQRLLNLRTRPIHSSDLSEEIIKATWPVAMKVQLFSIQYSQYLRESLEKEEVFTGYELELLGKIINVYNQLFLRLETSKNQNSPLAETAIETLILDNFWSFYENFFQTKKLRRVLKDIYKTQLQSNSDLKNLKIAAFRIANKYNQQKLRQELQSLPNGNSTLTQWILSTLSAKKLLSGKFLEAKKYILSDGTHHFFNQSLNFVSGVFGNTAGAIRWRQGHLYRRHDVTQKVKDQLKPLDIILEKTPFILTDFFIPGNFGHAAIWLGTEQQLKQEGLWNHPALIPWQEKIRSGLNIIEANRTGTKLNSLENFLNVDELAILRHTQLQNDPTEVAATYLRAFSQIGKRYDFTFNVSTTNAIVCSELIYYSFGKVNWLTKYILGQNIITPDFLAELVFYKKSPLELHYYTYAEDRTNQQVWNQFHLAKKLGWVISPNWQSPSPPIFGRNIKKCRTLIDRLRRKRKACRSVFTTYTYIEKIAYPDLDIAP